MNNPLKILNYLVHLTNSLDKLMNLNIYGNHFFKNRFNFA